MKRRFFTKVTSASLIAFVPGCTSLGPGSDDRDGNNSTDEDSSDDEPANETDDSVDPDEEDDGEADDANETDTDEEEPDTDEEDANDDADEPDDGDQGENDGEDDDETGEYDGDEDDETDDADQGEDDDEQSDDDQEDNDGDEDDADDDPPTENELEATIEMGAELEGMLEVVHHEFVWESYQGSHLCNIHVELRNATSDTDIWFEGIGSVTDADGADLGGDSARFGLQPQESTTHVFSMDGCADASGYRLEFEAFDG